MTLFFSRRALDTTKNKFTDNISSLTRYVSITGKTPGGKWSAKLLSQDNFIEAAEQTATSGDVLIYVHGYNTNQKDMLDRHKLIEDGLKSHGYSGVVISYDWPSEGKGTIGAYRRDLEKKAVHISKYLVEDAIQPILKSNWSPRVHLICHSMGTLVTADGFKRKKAGNWKVDQILLASGDAHDRLFEKDKAFAQPLSDHAERLTNYYSNDDAILTMALFYHGVPRVGQKGLPPKTEANHIDMYSTARYRAIVPDFDDDMAEKLYSHRWWFEDDRFYEDAAATLAGQGPEGLATRTKTNKGTWALKP